MCGNSVTIKSERSASSHGYSCLRVPSVVTREEEFCEDLRVQGKLLLYLPTRLYSFSTNYNLPYYYYYFLISTVIYFNYIIFELSRSDSSLVEDFISIDCGGLLDSVDLNSEFPYQSDKNLIDSGVIGQISPEFSEKFWLQYRTLRSFPEGVKNCYTLRPESGKNNNYLIRAVFVYGNYDGKNSTPVFRVYLGVNLWDTITRRNIRIESVYMAPTDYIDVCLINIGSGVPYISVLELRPLGNSVYRTDPRQFMALWDRSDVGGEYTLRYPQDIEDRIWVTYDDYLGSIKKIQTSGSIKLTSNDPYKLPESMLKTAYATLNSSIPFVYKWSPVEASSRFYFCFHFAEVEKLDTSVREMSIVLNGIHTISQSLKLEYLKPQTICSASDGLPVNLNEDNYLQISAASGSDLPPIINGFEFFYIINISHSPTLLQDVNAVMDIKKTFKLLNTYWQGDPCLPEFSVWNGLNCSTSNPPRIISLNLSRSKLTGEIPFSISNLTQLETLDLSYNDLSGLLPEFLAQLPRLKILNLTGNNLGGTVPEALLVKSRDGVLDLRIDDNPELCSSPPCKKKKKKKKVVVLPVIIAVIGTILIIACLVLLLIYKKSKKKNSVKSTEEKISLKQKHREYSYSEVVSITNNFRDIIGEGGFGKVYKGALKDKTLVAVKLLSSTSKQGYREFQTEAQLLMIVHHRNLVSLVGYCDEGNTKALIYEYMVNGNLRQRLSEKNTNVLSWNERLQIAVDAAHGLEYLHNGCKPTIVHRDLKPANILLDGMMQAKIADFGLSRTFQVENQSEMLTQLAGTPGYFDPENQTLGNLNKKSDIYSFGIILFELITGSPAITRSYNGNNIHLLDWVAPIIKKGKIEDVVDVRIKGEVNHDSARKMGEIAMSCTQPNGDQRPDISVVLEELKECLAVDLRTLSESYEFSSTILAEINAGPNLR
ncbi:putative leucine-rich repeat receptor-like serine/threonine-protein kinase At2g19230 [Benincasa hispida]|uniref:putative leucine-rich repeat receptor-like serine/threonine-protein kinase At2g19230 n=1 Tax=Benincasa hispida TaxID=102211 RepID=UPI0018FFC268|nr:putative leucine-rich repeat receptor-like serine/threonine-protein kinase At2g19230 [Benincasa hispida]